MQHHAHAPVPAWHQTPRRGLVNTSNLRMEICEQNEAFIVEDGDLKFSHTKIICKVGNQYFYAVTDRRYRLIADIDPVALTRILIPAPHIWPLFPIGFTQAPDPLPHNCHIKRPALIHYGDTEASTNIGCLLSNEAEVCEILRKSPHPNIAHYYGCIVHDGRITGLCFARYGDSLLERVDRNLQHLDADLCLKEIQSGVSHLHSLGLIHYDINPMNVVMDGDTPVIVDFDSCRREGEQLGFKAGTRGWTNENFTVARRENDQYGLSMIRDFLSQRKKASGQL
ncbi:serine/threonine-protein kinase-like protein [Melanomma pulvis-pyrius CBS 109.77]|uniref:Serine/threonine-protein kinase-like protein n=1 Tax=Melanomma pulvis-pyrius CBS 109.77 TaxID=1314802 RepID=A0A6A6XUE3_9PLEO|nr:serine/threonine-protein kinase-like protein [Melanomma pulvis-pyrius CBS 109.77]